MKKLTVKSRNVKHVKHPLGHYLHFSLPIFWILRTSYKDFYVDKMACNYIFPLTRMYFSNTSHSQKDMLYFLAKSGNEFKLKIHFMDFKNIFKVLHDLSKRRTWPYQYRSGAGHQSYFFTPTFLFQYMSRTVGSFHGNHMRNSNLHPDAVQPFTVKNIIIYG